MTSSTLMVEYVVVLIRPGAVQHTVAESSMFAQRRRR